MHAYNILSYMYQYILCLLNIHVYTCVLLGSDCSMARLPSYDFWSAWIGDLSRKDHYIYNTEYKKCCQVDLDDEPGEPIPEEILKDLLPNEKVFFCIKQALFRSPRKQLVCLVAQRPASYPAQTARRRLICE